MTLSDLQGHFKIKTRYWNIDNKPNQIQQQYKPATMAISCIVSEIKWDIIFIINNAEFRAVGRLSQWHDIGSRHRFYLLLLMEKT